MVSSGMGDFNLLHKGLRVLDSIARIPTTSPRMAYDLLLALVTDRNKHAATLRPCCRTVGYQRWSG